MISTVVFDMDGVLFDTERLCLEVWKKVAKEQKIGEIEDVILRCIGTNSNDTREIITGHFGPEFDYDGMRTLVDGEFRKEMEENGLPVKPGVRELLAYLKENNVQIGLASSTKLKSVESHLERAGIRDYFQVLVTGDMIVHSKPEPEIYLMACEKLGVAPENTYAIEDSYNGIRSAYRAGMKPIMVPDLIAPDEEMQSLSHVIFKDLTEVRDYFIGLSQDR